MTSGIKSSKSLGDINFCLSETKFKELKGKTTLKGVLKKIKPRRRSVNYMSKSEFEVKSRRLYKCCLQSVSDMHELHKRRILGHKMIEEFILRNDPNDIAAKHVTCIIWSMMSCLHHFQLRLLAESKGIVHYYRKRRVEKCMATYSKLIRTFRPDLHRLILNSIITFYKEGQMWEIDFACKDLIIDLLSIYGNVEEAINDILRSAENVSVVNITKSRHLIQVLYEVFEKLPWRRMSSNLMDRLLTMLEYSINTVAASDDINYTPLRNGLELCIRNVISNLRNSGLHTMLMTTISKIIYGEVSQDVLLDFGNIAAYAAKRFHMKTFFKQVTEKLVGNLAILSLIQKPTSILIASRIWVNLIDRNDNAMVLKVPRIYFQNCNYNIVMKKCRPGDKVFFKFYRYFLYDFLLTSFKETADMNHMELVFQASALTLVEIPCGYCASTFASIAMSLQEYAFQISSENIVRSHHFHATALAILSLVCYIHKGKVLNNYIMHIMERRAKWAPCLNPPMEPNYEYAIHHILWNRKDLFFEDWEIKYGLWKCFKFQQRKKKKKAQKSKV